MVIENDFNLGQQVFLKTDVNQNERLITAIQISPNGLLYRLACGNSDSWHFAFEVSIEKNVLKTNNTD